MPPMQTPSAPTQPDLALQLPRDAYWMVIHTLHTSLPPPPSDDPEAIARRDRDAIAQVASLLPVSAAEARLAARFVAADAQAHECLRLARLCPTDVERVLKCNAQAATMWRQSDSALRALQRMQAARCKRDSDPAAAGQAAWTEHCAQGFMADALHGGPAAFEPAPPPSPDPSAGPEPAAGDGEPAPDPIKEAEFYAVVYPARAVAIHRHGGMPPNATFPPPEDDIIHALVTGRTPALLALDREAADPQDGVAARSPRTEAPPQPVAAVAA
jgi:hypothetical protein